MIFALSPNVKESHCQQQWISIQVDVIVCNENTLDGLPED